jgi:hypothetical protein
VATATTERTAASEIADLLDASIDDPVLFNDLFLDGRELWDAQERIARSIVDYRTTVAYSGNMVGKDFLWARLALWWLCTRADSLVWITGPTQTQIGTICWKEIRKAYESSVLQELGFLTHITSAASASPQQLQTGISGWQALGFSTKAVERASGQHAGEMLVLVIEGSGIDDEIWDAIESLGYDRLAINGNPIRADGRFVELIRQAERDKQDEIPPRLAVNAIKITSLESPHAMWEKSPWGLADLPWLSSVARRYGENSLWFRSHVLAEIPEISADQLLPMKWFDYATVHKRRAVPPTHPIHDTRRISCDLGEGVGRDSSCVLVRDDWGVLAVEWGSVLGLPEAAELMRKLGRHWGVPAFRMSYDRLGIGRDFKHHLVRVGLEQAKPYAGSGSPKDRTSFTNLRSESAWNMRRRFDMTHAPDVRVPHAMQEPFSLCLGNYHHRLRDEIRVLTYECYGNQIKLMDKDDWATTLGHSPDIADTLIQSFSW